MRKTGVSLSTEVVFQLWWKASSLCWPCWEEEMPRNLEAWRARSWAVNVGCLASISTHRCIMWEQLPGVPPCHLLATADQRCESKVLTSQIAHRELLDWASAGCDAEEELASRSEGRERWAPAKKCEGLCSTLFSLSLMFEQSSFGTVDWAGILGHVCHDYAS